MCIGVCYKNYLTGKSFWSTAHSCGAGYRQYCLYPFLMKQKYPKPKRMAFVPSKFIGGGGGLNSQGRSIRTAPEINHPDGWPALHAHCHWESEKCDIYDAKHHHQRGI
jgi:hypothetical protein